MGSPPATALPPLFSGCPIDLPAPVRQATAIAGEEQRYLLFL
jgi:hypothetical protein